MMRKKKGLACETSIHPQRCRHRATIIIIERSTTHCALSRFLSDNKMDTLPELVEVLEELGYNFEDWYPLGLFLGIPPQDLTAIKVSEGSNLKMQFIKMVEKWQETKPAATWAKLCQALKKVGKHSLAEKISATYGNEAKTAVQQSKRTPPPSRSKTTAPSLPKSISVQESELKQRHVDGDPQGLSSSCIDREAKVPPIATTLEAPHVGASLPESMDDEIRGLEEEFDGLVDQAAADIKQNVKEGNIELSRVKSTLTRLYLCPCDTIILGSWQESCQPSIRPKPSMNSSPYSTSTGTS